MNRLILCLMAVLSTNSFALDDGAQLLSSWGIKMNQNGEVMYVDKPAVTLNRWVSSPALTSIPIEPSAEPYVLKPLIIYQQYK